jgi:mannose-6-phosphate isomerase-like protein (cupin superfamily)
MSYIGNVFRETSENENFRKVLFTGKRSQLVVMKIPVGGEVGEETHQNVEQTLFFLKGSAKAILDGQESLIATGEAVVVTPGTKHNFVNTGDEPLEIFTVYAPANHIEGRIHRTKTEADADREDEEFGEKVGGGY